MNYETSVLEVRKALKIIGTQKKMAAICGLSQPTIWRWVNGRGKVTPDRVPIIVEATKGECKAHLLRPDLTTLFPKP